MKDGLLSILQDKHNDKSPVTNDFLKVLVIDDEPTVHDITALVLKRYTYRNYQLRLRSAYSATEAREILASEGPFALILLDVVMETDDAGLGLVRFIREELDDQMVRIILRTGQPGMVPRRQVMRDYEIDDYKEKSELTSERFDSAITASIRTYLGYRRLNQTRLGLTRILDGIREVENYSATGNVGEKMLDQIPFVLDRTKSAKWASILVSYHHDIERIITGRGRLAGFEGKNLDATAQPEIIRIIREKLENKDSQNGDKQLLVSFDTQNEGHFIILAMDDTPFSDVDRYLVELYASHMNASLKNRNLNQSSSLHMFD